MCKWKQHESVALKARSTARLRLHSILVITHSNHLPQQRLEKVNNTSPLRLQQKNEFLGYIITEDCLDSPAVKQRETQKASFFSATYLENETGRQIESTTIIPGMYEILLWLINIR